jgi:hypothetical protein
LKFNPEQYTSHLKVMPHNSQPILSSFNRDFLALGFEEEFWSLKHLNSPSEASKLKEQEVSSTENMLDAASVGFDTEIGEEVEWPSMWKGRDDATRVVERGNLL